MDVHIALYEAMQLTLNALRLSQSDMRRDMISDLPEVLLEES